jgi:hypothetical protein
MLGFGMLVFVAEIIAVSLLHSSLHPNNKAACSDFSPQWVCLELSLAMCSEKPV